MRYSSSAWILACCLVAGGCLLCGCAQNSRVRAVSRADETWSAFSSAGPVSIAIREVRVRSPSGFAPAVPGFRRSMCLPASAPLWPRARKFGNSTKSPT